ncbi:hypothetical protein D9756_006180 [Leucocoprinus leucothites]|uniref:Uncharacterized protein n=1 Tax=Leucocoprinus leucothites TaxID=201217 RepID=A0A8H5D297_9AGAR|nr:hypothetical protein D9756_006180 [Leucoagaricus leucothites]
MPDSVIVVPHPPAMKVGGRRRSVSSKHRTHNTGSVHMTEPTASEESGGEAVTDDYPRPAPPSEGQVHQHDGHNQYQDEEQTRKDKRQPFSEKVKEYSHWKAETTRPTRDIQANFMKVCGASGRIAQPAGKGAQ